MKLIFKNFSFVLLKRPEHYGKISLERQYCSFISTVCQECNKFNVHIPGENHMAKNYVITEETKNLLNQHLARTGGQVRTRFPPEPNGVLHIGHAKAININFEFASRTFGVCFLRFDDTNPEMEDQSYIDGIKENIAWLGFKPDAETYASDYFEQLHAYAGEIIRKNLAYVCHQPKDVPNAVLSQWRDRPVEESNLEFEKMRNGEYPENAATLRMKMTTEQGTVDPVIYRIKYARHHRTENDWCIFPTYDFAHSLCDSMQDITHSFCSSEFSLRRSTYYWICNALNVYCPVQIEYGRLNILHNVLSKRKISTLIEKKLVQGWDDPRLYTLEGLRRRGFPAYCINQFCSQFGLRSDSSFISPVHLIRFVRDYMEKFATRIMVVMNPLKVIIKNFPSDECYPVKVANVPKTPDHNFHHAVYDRQIWIEKDDFSEEDIKGYRRLTANQCVGLKHTGFSITLDKIVRHKDGSIDHLEVKSAPAQRGNKPKAFIHWVAKPSVAEVRLYGNLFKSERPGDLKSTPNGFLSDLVENSFKKVEAFVGKTDLKILEPNFKSEFDTKSRTWRRNFDTLQDTTWRQFQFERVGYFILDKESTFENEKSTYENKESTFENEASTSQNEKFTRKKLIFNRIVELKQDEGFQHHVNSRLT